MREEEWYEQVLHCPLPALTDHSHLVLNGDRFRSSSSGVVLYLPSFPFIPLVCGNASGISLGTEKRNQIVVEFSRDQSITLLGDAPFASIVLAFLLAMNTTSLVLQELLHQHRNRQGNNAPSLLHLNLDLNDRLLCFGDGINTICRP